MLLPFFEIVQNIWEHIGKTMMNITKVYILYEPLKVFFILSLPSLFVGLAGSYVLFICIILQA